MLAQDSVDESDDAESDKDDSTDSRDEDAAALVLAGWHVEWPALEVKDSEQDGNAGMGVFARRQLQPWESIPIIGIPLSENSYQTLKRQELNTHVSFTRNGMVDGHPRHTPFNGIGGHGQYISSLVNEPSRRKPNLVMRGNYLIVARFIHAGEELLVSYGPKYEHGYPVSRYALEKQHFDALER